MVVLFCSRKLLENVELGLCPLSPTEGFTGVNGKLSTFLQTTVYLVDSFMSSDSCLE